MYTFNVVEVHTYVHTHKQSSGTLQAELKQKFPLP